MSKYNIEGQLDFFAELYKSLDVIDNEEDCNNKCLISNQLLTDKFVTLNCGHKFNYIPIYNDLINHKCKYNVMENQKGKLKLNEIRCPYCRKKQTKLLPYYDDLNLEKVNGINFYNSSVNMMYNHNNCNYKIPNVHFIDTEPETNINSKLVECLNCFGTKINIYNNGLEPINYGDNNYYCYKHKKQVIKEHQTKELLDKKAKVMQEKEEKQQEKEKKKEEKQQEKQKKKEEKEKKKEEKQQEKQQEKQKKKEEKQKKKEEKQKKKEDNLKKKNVIKKKI
jgi:hypothetical protein